MGHRRILTSLHGKELGLTHNRELLAPKGLVVGDPGDGAYPGQPIPIAVNPRVSVLWDDFTEFDSTTKWLVREGTDSATINADTRGVGVGGVLRLHSGDTGTGFAADGVQVNHAKALWRAEYGRTMIQMRAKLTDLSNVFCFIGFTDFGAASLEIPIESAGSGNNLTTNATDAVGFLYDTRMTNPGWWLVGVKGDAAATPQLLSAAPVADTYQTFNLHLEEDGGALASINGDEIQSDVMTAAVTATQALVPIFVLCTTEAVSKNLDVDYVHVSMNREP